MRAELFRKHTDAFIETGSYIGLGIELALRSGFQEVYSIELTEHYFKYCQEKFKDDKRVHLIHGDSFFFLEKLLEDHPEKKFTYWLDGHFSGGDTGFGHSETPLIQELDCILIRGITGELIYIDDMRIYRNFSEEVNLEKIQTILGTLAPHCKVWFEPSIHDKEDILVIET